MIIYRRVYGYCSICSNAIYIDEKRYFISSTLRGHWQGLLFTEIICSNCKNKKGWADSKCCENGMMMQGHITCIMHTPPEWYSCFMCSNCGSPQPHDCELMRNVGRYPPPEYKGA